MYSSLNVHNIKEVKILSRELETSDGKTQVLTFVFEATDGSRFEVAAFGEADQKINLILGCKND